MDKVQQKLRDNQRWPRLLSFLLPAKRRLHMLAAHQDSRQPDSTSGFEGDHQRDISSPRSCKSSLNISKSSHSIVDDGTNFLSEIREAKAKLKTYSKRKLPAQPPFRDASAEFLAEIRSARQKLRKVDAAEFRYADRGKTNRYYVHVSSCECGALLRQKLLERRSKMYPSGSESESDEDSGVVNDSTNSGTDC